ncbi:MAG TPA: hypothetical protein VGY53_08405, partial [Isosphaeraceae bacterium]|nr:hypothetical protein [Isosphaeraceae bacterium]
MGLFGTTRPCWIMLAVYSVSMLGYAHAETTPPLVDGKPVEVSIGFSILDFARVTSRDESFDVTGYLELTWRDPRLAGGTGANARPRATRSVDASTIWTPRIFFENALEQPKYHHEPVVEADNQGHVTSWVILTGKFSAPMDLKRFPFDHQVLGVRIGPFEDESIVKFVVKREMLLV